MNCPPTPLPTFLSPDGSNEGGAAYAIKATYKIVNRHCHCCYSDLSDLRLRRALTVESFIMTCVQGSCLVGEGKDGKDTEILDIEAIE